MGSEAPRKPLQEYEEAKLLGFYLQNTSKWFKVTDFQTPFTSTFSDSMVKSPLLRSAAIAVASKHRDSLAGKTTTSASTRKLCPSLVEDPTSQRQVSGEDDSTGAVHVLLTAYLMMSAEYGAAQRQLRQVATLLELHGWNIPPNQAESGMFWVFARMG